MKSKNAYIICTTPRSGSTLFCDLLKGTNVAGRPNTFFKKEFYSYWASYLNVSVANWNNSHEFDQSYLKAVLLEGAGKTGVFAMRLQCESLDDLSKRLGVFHPGKKSDSERICAAFGSCHYIHLSRADKIAQAVSLLRAEQSGLWHIHTDGTERERIKEGHAPVYNFKTLSKLITELNEHDSKWMLWFSQQKIQPISITYEDLSADPKAVIANVLSALSLDPTNADTVEPKTAKLSNSESHEWVKRFRAEQIEQSI